jgi:uncharacterized protein YjiS (DUF1127 family)
MHMCQPAPLIRIICSILWILGMLSLTGCSENAETPSQPFEQPQENALALPGAEEEIPEWAGNRPDEPFDVKAFLQSRMAPKVNSMPLCLAAMGELYEDFDFAFPPEERNARQQKAHSLSIRISEAADKLPGASVSISDVEEILALAQPALQKLEQAQSDGQCFFVTGLKLESLLPHAQAARIFARLAMLEIFHAKATNNFEEGEQSIRRTLRLARDLRPRGAAITQLVSYAVTAVVLQAMRDSLLADAGLERDKCDRLLAILREHQENSIDPYLEGIRIQYIIERNTIEEFHQQRRPMDDVIAASVDWERERKTYSELYSQILSEAKRPYHEVLGTSVTLKSRMDQLRNDGLTIAPAIFPAMDQMREAATRDQTRLRACEALIRIRRYISLHGHPPESLETVFQEAPSAAVPIDPYSGQHLRYVIQQNRPVVYSVGADQNDDGALVDWNFGKQPGDFIFKL